MSLNSPIRRIRSKQLGPPQQRTGQLGQAPASMYTLAQLQSLNGTACYLTGPDGASYTPAQYAAQFYQTTLPELNPCAAVVAPPPAPPPSVSTAVVTPVSTTAPTAPPTPGTPANPIYRLILAEPDGTFSTGANYPGCSQTQTALCDPESFPTLAAALQYAANGNEIPVLVTSEAQAWNIVAGNTVPSPAQILPLPAPNGPDTPAAAATTTPTPAGGFLSSPLTIGLLAVGAYFLLKGK